MALPCLADFLSSNGLARLKANCLSLLIPHFGNASQFHVVYHSATAVKK
jgi:hypothetical protein